MRQRCSGVTHGTYCVTPSRSIRFWRSNLVPRLVRRGPIARRYLAARDARIDGQLAAVVDHVHEDLPQKVEPPHVAHVLAPRVSLRGRVQEGLVCLTDL